MNLIDGIVVAELLLNTNSETMDRPLDPEFVTTKKRNRVIKFVLIGGAVVMLYFLISGYI